MYGRQGGLAPARSKNIKMDRRRREARCQCRKYSDWTMGVMRSPSTRFPGRHRLKSTPRLTEDAKRPRTVGRVGSKQSVSDKQ